MSTDSCVQLGVWYREAPLHNAEIKAWNIISKQNQYCCTVCAKANRWRSWQLEFILELNGCWEDQLESCSERKKWTQIRSLEFIEWTNSREDNLDKWHPLTQSANPAALRLTVDIDGLLIDGHVSLWHCWGCHVHTAVGCEVVPKDPLQKGTRYGGDLEVYEGQRNKIKGGNHNSPLSFKWISFTD